MHHPPLKLNVMRLSTPRRSENPCRGAVCNVEFMHATHGLFNVAGEDMNLEVLRAPVTLSKGETVTFHRALLSTCTEQHLVDGK